MMINWGMVSLVYYGAGLSSTTLGGDIFLNFTLVAFMEVLGNIAVAFIINHWGRKTTLVMGFILAAIGCFGVGFLPNSEGNVFLFFLLLGKFGGAFAFTSLYIFTAELFPTPIRNTALGTLVRAHFFSLHQVAQICAQILFKTRGPRSPHPRMKCVVITSAHTCNL